jgi:hypothetical protein
MDHPDRRYVPARPDPGCIVLDVFTRVFELDAKGEPHKAQSVTPGGDWAARDKMWVFEPEWRALVPTGAKPGDRVPLPGSLVHRLAAFHLRDNTGGQGPRWQRSEIRTNELALTVEEAGSESVKLRLNGTVVLSTSPDLKRAERGIDLKLLGYLSFDVRAQRFTRFDVVALGRNWATASHNGEVRQGKGPIGFAIQLAAGSPYDQVAPDFMKLREYVTGE